MTIAILQQLVIACLFLALVACSTTYIEMEGECVLKKWVFANVSVRSEVICALPIQRPNEIPITDIEQVDPYGGADAAGKIKDMFSTDKPHVEQQQLKQQREALDEEIERKIEKLKSDE